MGRKDLQSYQYIINKIRYIIQSPSCSVDGGTSIDINLNRKRPKIKYEIAEFENKT